MTRPVRELSKKGRSKKKKLHERRAVAAFNAMLPSLQKAVVEDLKRETAAKMSAEIALQPKRGPRAVPPGARTAILAAAALAGGGVP